MFSSGFRRRLAFAAAYLLCGIAASGVATADEGDELASAIIARIHERLPATASQMTPADENRVTSFSHYILKTFYYSPNLNNLKAAAVAAIDATEPPTDATSLAQAAMGGVVNSLGHGARFLATLGADYPEPGASGGPSTRDVGSLRIVALPTMNISDPNVRRRCVDFARYFDANRSTT